MRLHNLQVGVIGASIAVALLLDGAAQKVSLWLLLVLYVARHVDKLLVHVYAPSHRLAFLFDMIVGCSHSRRSCSALIMWRELCR